MAKYIDAEAVKRALVEAVDSGMVATLDAMEELVDDLPAADVEPVVHAHWIVDDEYLACSHCGGSYLAGDTRGEVEFLLAYGDVNKRCHGCGAHMDEGVGT